MSQLRYITVVALAALVLGTGGCKKKKPPVPQAQVPTATAPAQPPQQAATPPATEPPKTAPATTAPATTQTATKPKPKPRRTPRKTTPTTTAKATPPSTTVQPPAASTQPEPETPSSTGIQISTPAAHTDSAHAGQSAQQLIDSTESNLNGLKRSLNANEHAMVGQIRSYLEQARKALAESDTVRGHNLALKAHMLSDELVK